MSRGILIADDSANTRRIVREYFTRRQFSICGEAIDGDDAIEKTRQLRPSLVILDLVMPQANAA